VAVRHRARGDQGARPVEEFVAGILEEIRTRAIG
jgi:threonyl-tRNA synthetase